MSSVVGSYVVEASGRHYVIVDPERHGNGGVSPDNEAGNGTLIVWHDSQLVVCVGSKSHSPVREMTQTMRSSSRNMQGRARLMAMHECVV